MISPSEPTWPAVGVQCMCLRDFPWERLRPGPKFMQVCVVSDIGWADWESDGHKLKIGIVGYPSPDLMYCACQFQPLDPLKPGEEAAREYMADQKLGGVKMEPV